MQRKTFRSRYTTGMYKAKQNLWDELGHPVKVLAEPQVPPTDSVLVPRHPQLQLARETHPFSIITDKYELNSIKI